MAGADLVGKSVRRRTAFARIESVTGVPETNFTSEDGILCKTIDVTPLESNTVAREFIRDSFGGFSELIVSRASSVAIEVDLRDAINTPATNVIPEIDTFWRMCGMDRVILDSDNAPKYVASGGNFILAPTPADSDKGVLYRPTSGLRTVTTEPTSLANAPSPGLCTGTIQVYADGKLHQISGAMGTFVINMNVSELPSVTFTFTGDYREPTDTARPSGDAGKRLPVPLVVSNDNTVLTFPPSLNPRMYNFSFDAGNEITRPAVVGAGISTRLVDRRSSGSIEVQSSAVEANNPWRLMGTGQTSVIKILHRNPAAPARTLEIDLPRCAYGAGTYGDQDSVETIVIPLQMIASDSGNDELLLRYIRP